MKRILSLVRKAVQEYDMIQDGDKIAVGISGGKDSLVLAYTLQQLSRFYPKKFEVFGITLDMGFDADYTFDNIAKWCDDIGIKYYIEKTEIADIIFNQRQEKNPCSLCARMRRGALHDLAIQHGSYKLALGHNFDDTIQTFFMNLFFEGRIGCFNPVSFLDRKKITVIRPLIYVDENKIKNAAHTNNIPVLKSPCPADSNTKREYMKNLINKLNTENVNLKTNLFTAIKNSELKGWKTCEDTDFWTNIKK